MFKKNLIVLLLISIFSTNPCYAVTVGDSYGGGTVFCVSKTSDTTKCVTEKGASGDYGLIMANEDQANYDSPNHGITWSSEYKEVGASAQSDDNGAANTTAIIKALPNDNPSNNAAWLCHNYKKDQKEGRTDWYLPSKNELNKMYLYAKANDLIGKGCSGSKTGGVQCLVGSDWDQENNRYNIYWSSTEYAGSDYFSDYSGYNAWDQNFSNGHQHYNNKSYYRGVRAVGAFNNLKNLKFTPDQNQQDQNQEIKIEKERKKEDVQGQVLTIDNLV